MNKNSRKTPIITSAITHAVLATHTNQQALQTETASMVKSNDAVPEVTSPSSLSLTEAPRYSADDEEDGQIENGTLQRTATEFRLRDVTSPSMATKNMSPISSAKESRLSDVMTSREASSQSSFTGRVLDSPPATSTQLPKTTSSMTSLPQAVFPSEEPSRRMRQSTTLPTTSSTAAQLPTRQSTSSWATQTPSHTIKAWRPKKTKNRRPYGTRKTASGPTGRSSHARPNSRCNNNAPVIKNPIGKLIHEAGSILTFNIANDTFVDCEDGDTSRLQLLLTSAQYMTLPPNSWIKLNSFSRTLYGLPLDIHVGHHEFILAAIDSDGKIARCPFEVHVRRRPSSAAISHEVSVVINVDYQLFAQLVDKRIDVANKIGSVFGDRDPTQYIVVTRLSPGSVIYTWTNSSLRVKHGTVCPVKEITALASHIQHRDGTLNDRFVRMMRPYAIQNVSVIPHGPCQEAFRSSPHRHGGHLSAVGDDDELKPIQVQSRPRDADNDPVNYDSLLYILIPLVVLAIILIILLIFICCRELRSRSAVKTMKHTKMHSSSSSSSALSTIKCSSKGIPVIFAEELVDGCGGSGAANYYTGKRRDRAAEDATPVASSPPDYKASVKHHGDWDAVLSSADKVRDNKALLVSDDEDDDDVSSTTPGHHNSLRYRSADRRTRMSNERDQGSIEQTSAGSRGLRPPTQLAYYSGNSPPPPYK